MGEVEESFPLVAGRPRTFDDVQREDADFKAAAAAAPAMDPAVVGPRRCRSMLTRHG